MLAMGRNHHFMAVSGQVVEQGEVVMTITGLKGLILTKLLEEGKDKYITKDELIYSTWGKNDSTVYGPSLTQQIYLLRKELDKIGFDNYIVYQPKAGYRLNIDEVMPEDYAELSDDILINKKNKGEFFIYLVLIFVIIVQFHIEFKLILPGLF